MPLQSQSRENALWNKLVIEGLTYDGEANTSLPFVGMSRKYGKAWIAYLTAAWQARDGLSTADFCRLNGGVPESFVEKNLDRKGSLI